MKFKKALSTVLTMAIAAASFCSCKVASEEVVSVRVGALSGPTTIGIVNLINDSANGQLETDYQLTMATQPDEIAAAINAGDLDIALIPANLAAVLYNRTEGGIRAIDINTYGVLYCISNDDSISSVSDLAGKTVITTGQGATPEYAINYLLDQYGVTDCTLDFKTEGAEVVASLQADPNQIAILPQPAATAALAQVEGLISNFSLNDEWNSVSPDSAFVTGVTVVRTAFLEEHSDLVERFLVDHHNSVIKSGEDLEGTAQLVVDQGIIGAVPVAQRAIPLCNIACVTGADMKNDLSAYLQTLFDANPQSIGGALPGDDFYWINSGN